MTALFESFQIKKLKSMKDLTQTMAVIILAMIVASSNANVQLPQPANHELCTNYVFTAGGSRQQPREPLITDSLLQLQKNYPPVYQHLIHEFKNAALVHYAVERDLLLISFTCDNHKILSVYTATGEFRHSIADIGLALPHTITEQLKKEYPAFTVYYGREIRANNKNMYQVVIENKYEYRLINFLDAEIEEVKRLKK
jgi:hypothetical protein